MAGNLGSRIARVDVIIGGVQQAKAQLKEMGAQMKQYAETAEKARKAMEASTGTIAYDRHKKEYEDAQKNQKQLERAIRLSQQNINTVDKYLQDISGQALRNLQAARRTMQQALLSVGPKDTEGLETVRGFITQIADEIKRRKGDLVEFSDIIGDIGNVSDRSLGMAKQRLQDLIASTKLNADEMKKYREQLRQVEEEQQRRVSSQAGKVMGNLSGSSLNEIQEAVRTTTQLRDAQKLGSEEWEIYNDEIQRAQKYLADFNNFGKQLAMSDRMKELGKASTDSLAELRKFWQEQVDGAERGSLELAEYEKNLKRVTDEQRRRSEDNAYDVIDNIDNHSVGEIKNAVKALEQLQETTERGDAIWYAYGRRIDKAKEYLESFARADRETGMEKRMQNLGTASNASLAELRKFWQEQVDGAEYASKEMQKFQEQLRTVQQEEQKRTSERAQTTMGNVQAGTFDGTIAETREAVKLLEQYKQQLKASDTKGIRDADEAIQALNDRIRQATTASMSMKDALDKAATVGQGRFDGTYEDLQRLKQTLEEYQKQLKVGDAKGLEKIQMALRDIDKEQKKVSQGTVDINRVMKDLRTAPLEQLQKAAAQLQRELTEAERNSEAYIKSSARLRQVSAQIDRVKKSWEQHDSQIVATAKRLTSYVLVYAGFNEVVGRIKQLTTANLELSDSLANIQKTTGLTTEEVAELSREIDSLDTRATQKELHDLAYEAGKLGISAEEDVLSFVKAGNQVITALGDELGGADAVRNLMKINDLLGETSRLGVEKALLATGSAMNELSNVSTASAGPISEIVSRLGAVGAQANLSMADLIALGGTADELSQEIEVSGTALSKFVTALQTNTHSIAQAIGVDDKELENLMEAGKTMEAIILVLRQVRGMGGLKEIGPIMKEFGSDGERLDRVVTALATNVDTLEKRVRQSREAFAEATSVTNEYNVMNESAMALAQRLGNMIMEKFVNSGFVEWLESVLRHLMDIPNWIERNRLQSSLLAGALTAVGTAISLLKLRQLGVYLAGPFVQAWEAATAAVIKSGKTVTGFAGIWNKLTMIMKSNPWGVAITALASLYAILSNVIDQTTRTMEAIGELETKINDQKRAISNLVSAINDENTATERRSELIGELNKKYHSYLGFMLEEAASAREVEAAMGLINARIRERLSLQMRETMEKNINEKYALPQQEAISGLVSELSDAEEKLGINAAETMSRIQAAIDESIKNAAKNKLGQFEDFSVRDVLDRIQKELGMGQESAVGYSLFLNLRSDLIDLIETERDLQEETSRTEHYINSKFENVQKEVHAASVTMLDTLKKEYDEVAKISTEGMNEDALAQHNTRILELARNYVKAGGEVMKSAGEEQRKAIKQNVDFFNSEIKRIAPEEVKSINVWGEGLTLESASVDQLVGKYKELHNERKTLKEDADYETVYSKQFKDRVDAMKWYLDEMNTIKKRLNDMGYDEYGNLLKEKGSGRSKSYSYNGAIKTAKEIKEESTAALSALEAYFNKEKELINRAYLDEEITEEEKNARLLKKEEEFLRDRVALRQRLLGRKGGENFNQEKYVHTDTVTGETTNYFEGKDLGQLSGFIRQMGQAMTDGILNQLTIDELKIQQAMVERMKNIQKIILDNDFTGQVDKQYQDQLEALELFWGESEDETQKAAERRLAILRNLSERSYELTAASLKSEMEQNEEFSEWIVDRKDEEYQALLISLRKYHDDYEAAENRSIERRKKIADKQWEKSGQKRDWQQIIDNGESGVELMGTANSLGLASDAMVDDAQLKLYQLKVEASVAYIEQLDREISAEIAIAQMRKKLAEQDYENMKDKEGEDDPKTKDAKTKVEQATEELNALKETQESLLFDARQNLNEAVVDMENQQMDIQERKLQTLKGYTDAVVDFSEQMGAAAFGEVEDRKEAAKQLLQTTMNLTKQLIMQKVQELITKRLLKKQEENIETSGDKNIMQSKGGVILSGLNASKAAMGGKIQEGIAGGSAKIISELGWWGIPLIAVISAALNALMGLAMSKLDKSAHEVTAVTGASSSKGRVAAGMLTYAEGDYPVLGNDGHIYNARYQKELKTGVYRGGAHFGIFSEKKPEMIVDGDTTQKLVLNYPHIYESILTIARNGSLKAAMPTFASGSYPSLPAGTQGGQTGAAVDASGHDSQMQQTLAGLQTAVAALTRRLDQPINATMDAYSANKTLNKTDKFMRKRGLIK